METTSRSGAGRPLIVVGQDGSSAAGVTLRRAHNEGRAVSGRVMVVRPWSVSSATRPVTQTVGYVHPMNDFVVAVADALRDDFAGAVADQTVDLARTLPVD